MSSLADNRQARHEYDLLEKFEAGIKLSGPEVKAVRGGNLSLKGAHIMVKASGAFLINAHVGRYKPAGPQPSYDERRTRALLLNKRELHALFGRISREPLTVIPLAVYTSGGLIKLEIALARRRKLHQKREAIKKRDLDREMRGQTRG